MADRVLLILALRDGAPIAGALNLIGAEALYGRYWGCARGRALPPFRALLLSGDRRRDRARPARVEAGAQGAHKLARGYRPVPTFSAHYIADPGFRARGGGLSRRERPRGRARDRRAGGNDAVPQRLSRLSRVRAGPLMIRASKRGRAIDAEILWRVLAILLLWAGAAPPPPRRRARSAFSPRATCSTSRPPTDPQISPDGRWIAYVRRSGDIMTDRFRPLDLADRHRAPAGRCRSRRHRRAASRAGRPTGDRLAYIAAAEGGQRAAVRALDGDRARRCAITGLPDRAEQHRLVAGRAPDRLCDVRARRGRSGSARRSRGPEGANWAEPLQVITAVTYRADGQGYLRPGYDQLFLVSADGGAPRQLTYGPYQQWRPALLDAGRAHAPVQRQPLARIGSARASTPKSTRSTSPPTGSRALTTATGRTTSRRCRPTAG